MEKRDRFKYLKIGIKFVASGLVELFIGATVGSVMGDVEGGPLPKLGARIGGALVGLMIGDQVGDYLCDELDSFMGDIEDIKSAIEEE